VELNGTAELPLATAPAAAGGRRMHKEKVMFEKTLTNVISMLHIGVPLY